MEKHKYVKQVYKPNLLKILAALREGKMLSGHQNAASPSKIIYTSACGPPDEPQGRIDNERKLEIHRFHLLSGLLAIINDQQLVINRAQMP